MTTPVRHAQRQRVEVTRTIGGLVVHDIGTVVDLPTEAHVRVQLDEQPGVAKIYDADQVRPIPEAVARHITNLIRALGAVSDAEVDEVESMLTLRIRQHGPDLIGFARSVDALDNATDPAKAVGR